MAEISTVPAHAERVDILTVFKTVERPSQFVPGQMARVRIVECPSCHETHPDFPAIETLTCKCGLSMRCEWGTTFIWRDLAPAEAE